MIEQRYRVKTSSTSPKPCSRLRQKLWFSSKIRSEKMASARCPLLVMMYILLEISLLARDKSMCMFIRIIVIQDFTYIRPLLLPLYTDMASTHIREASTVPIPPSCLSFRITLLRLMPRSILGASCIWLNSKVSNSRSLCLVRT